MALEITPEMAKKIAENYAAADDKQKASMKKVIDMLVAEIKTEKPAGKSKLTWGDPMIDQQNLERKQEQKKIEKRLTNMREQQKPEQFSYKSIWGNHLQNVVARNTSETLQPVNRMVQKNPIIPTAAWPKWETVRQNSKWQYYYINQNGNAVIVWKNPAFDKMQDRLNEW